MIVDCCSRKKSGDSCWDCETFRLLPLTSALAADKRSRPHIKMGPMNNNQAYEQNATSITAIANPTTTAAVVVLQHLF